MQLLAHNCWCQSCFMSARAQLGHNAGVVCGHLTPRRGWFCVYCGGNVYRHTAWPVALWQSVCSWVGWASWELKVGWALRHSSKG